MRMSKMGFSSTKLENVGSLYPGQDILLQTGQLFQNREFNFLFNLN